MTVWSDSVQLEILTFCDAATEQGGRLNILGATDHIGTPVLPFKYPQCAVVARLRAARIEEGSHTMRLMIIDADGQPLLNVEGKMEIRFHQGMGGVVNLIINAHQLEFREAGEYALEIAVDGIQLGSTPLFVQQREPVQPQPNRPEAAPPSDPPAGDTGSSNGGSSNGGLSNGGSSNGGSSDPHAPFNGGRRII